MIGSTLEERFRVEEYLVRQGLVEIYEGIDLEEEENLVWIKRIGPPLSRDNDFAESWRAQMLSIKAVNDEHLPHLYSYGRLPDGDLYQVESPPPGSSLRRYATKHTPMNVGATVRLIALLARAVGVAHREGIAHGALSPEVLFVDEEVGSGTLIGFVGGWEGGEMMMGLRRLDEPLPDRLARYLAPEQLRLPVPPATPASDIYALALMLYELLAGSLPVVPAGGEAVASPRRYNPEIPAVIEQILLRALNPDPATRPPNGLAFASALLQALEHPDPTPPPSMPVEERVERVERITTVQRPAWLPVAGLIGLLLCVILFLTQQLNQRNQSAGLQGTATPLIQTVPNLVGPPFVRYNEAVSAAWNQGYLISIIGFRDDPALPPGVVVSQCPLPGALPGAFDACLSPGVPRPLEEQTILVEVSSLPAPTVLRVVPDLYGQGEQDARSALEQGGLRLGIRRTAYDLLLPAGRIIEQNPRRGLAVLPGTPVDIIVSGGAPPAGGELVPPSNAQPTPTLFPPTPLPSPTLDLFPTPTLALAPTSTNAPTTAVLLSEDFEAGNEAGWQTQQGAGLVAQIEEGVLHAEVNDPDLFWKAQAGRLFNDFRYRATVTLLPGNSSSEGGAGLLARIQDEQHFYFFEIRGDGMWRLRARNGEFWQELIDWTTEPALLPPGATNILEIQAEGERLTLFINGSQVSAAFDLPSDLFYPSGDIGFGIESGSEPYMANFDEVLVTTAQ